MGNCTSVNYYANQDNADQNVNSVALSTNNGFTSILNFNDSNLSSLQISGSPTYWISSSAGDLPGQQFYPGVTVPVPATGFYMIRLYPGGYVICFGEQTKITCLINGIEQLIPIKEMTEDSLVKTYTPGGNSYKKVYKIGSGKIKNGSNKWQNNMYILEDYPDLIEPLTLTGGHSILIDTYDRNYCLCQNGNPVKIEGKYLLIAGLSPHFKKIENNQIYTYYHFCLESEDLNQRHAVYANGILSETPSKAYWDTHPLQAF